MNILILTGNFGLGHTSAANAIAARLQCAFDNANIVVADLFKATFNTRKYDVPFRIMMKRGQYFYNRAYRHSEERNRKKPVPFARNLRDTLSSLLEQTEADIIISTLWSCSTVVSDFKEETGCAIPLITCITDVTTHSGWIRPQTDYYLAAAPIVKADLISKGVEPWRIFVSGIPVRGDFTPVLRPGPRTEKQLLIMGGGLGLLPKSRSFYEELSALPDVMTTVITGNNTALYHTLKDRYPHIRVLGFVHNVSDYMKNADLLISKPGGITLFESIYAELPMLFIPPFLEHEVQNGQFILQNGLGAALPDKPKLWCSCIRDMLANTAQLGAMRANMGRFRLQLDKNALLRLLTRYESQCVCRK